MRIFMYRIFYSNFIRLRSSILGLAMSQKRHYIYLQLCVHFPMRFFFKIKEIWDICIADYAVMYLSIALSFISKSSELGEWQCKNIYMYWFCIIQNRIVRWINNADGTTTQSLAYLFYTVTFFWPVEFFSPRGARILIFDELSWGLVFWLLTNCPMEGWLT